MATTAEGYKSTVLAVARCNGIDVSSSVPHGAKTEGKEQLCRWLQKAKGASDLYVQSNTWAPVTIGVVASTGWHTHPGQSLVIVTAGTITEYHADCKPRIYVTGDTFVDPGDGEEHILRNESSTEPASTMAVQLVPHDSLHLNRRIDAPAPENCKDIM